MATSYIAHPASAGRHDCLYVKLFLPGSAMDRVLVREIGPLTDNLVVRHGIDSWHYLRYKEDGDHLRLRIFGHPHELAGPLVRALDVMRLRQPYGLIRRIQFDDYQPELKRYGGRSGIQFAEQAFFADSAATLAVLAALARGESGSEITRWQACLAGIHALMDDFGLSLAERCDVLNGSRDKLLAELTLGRLDRQFIGQRYRAWRSDVDSVLAHPPLWLSTILEQRSRRMRSALSAWRHRDDLPTTLLERRVMVSLLHLHVNRLFAKVQKGNEMVLYEFLARAYRSLIARKLT